VSDITKFADALHEEIEERLATPSDYSSEVAKDVAVAEIFVERLEDYSYISEPEFSPYCDVAGRGQCEFTGTSYIEDARRLIIFVGHSAGSTGAEIPSVTAQTLGQLYGRAARFLTRALSRDFNSFRENAAAADAARSVHAKRAEIEQARVLILTDGRARSRDFADITIDNLPVECDVVDIDRLYRISQEATSREDIVVDFVAMTGRPLACVEMKPRPPEYDTYLAILSGDLIFALYEKYGQRLFEFNVRSYLQAKGRVNKGIRETLKSSPARFMAYNNGIVATADEVTVSVQTGELCITKLVGLQIVNGAQTTASIHRARKMDKLDLSAVAVSAKITRVDAAKLAEFVPLISMFANTQNSVHVADLSANSEFHIELERLSQITWCPGETTRWFYERARGSYEVAMLAAGSPVSARKAFKLETPPSQRISKTDVARYWLACAGRPHTVSTGAQKSFATFMAELPDTFPKDWVPDAGFFRDIVARAILYRGVEKVVRAKKFPAYRANIVAYAVAYIFYATKGEVQLGLIWEAQGPSAGLVEFLDPLTVTVDQAIRKTAGARNVTEWCKKPECWDQVRPLLPRLPTPLPPELRPPDQTAGDADDVEGAADEADIDDTTSNIDICVDVTADTWAKLSHWGQLTKRLTYVERGVCHTLAEYANAGWVRKPSEKQARHGVHAIELARKDGILND
jgi:hypothetical protein